MLYASQFYDELYHTIAICYQKNSHQRNAFSLLLIVFNIVITNSVHTNHYNFINL